MPIKGKVIATGLAGLISGLALGVLISKHGDNGMPSAGQSSQKDSAELAQAVITAREPDHRQQSERAAHLPENPVSLTPPAILAGYSGLRQHAAHGSLVVVPANLISSLSRSGLTRSLDTKLFSDDGELATYLQLDAAQIEKLEADWSNLRREVRELESRAVKMEEMSDGSLQVVLPELTQQMDLLDKRFRASILSTLGPNRAEILIATAQIAQVLASQGAARKLTIRAEETGNGGWRYHSVLDGPQGKRTYVGETIPPSLKHLTGALEIAEFY